MSKHTGAPFLRHLSGVKTSLCRIEATGKDYALYQEGLKALGTLQKSLVYNG